MSPFPPGRAMNEKHPKPDKSALVLMAVEFGYKQCEKGHSLGAALTNALALLSDDPPSRSGPSRKSAAARR